MRGWHRGLFAVGTAAQAARRFKWAASAVVGALLAEILAFELAIGVVPPSPGWLAPVLVGGIVAVDLGLCVLVVGTALEYAAWVRQTLDVCGRS